MAYARLILPIYGRLPRGRGNAPGEIEMSSMSSRPISFGIEGPKMSKSRMPTRGRVGCKASDMARLTAGGIYVKQS